MSHYIRDKTQGGCYFLTFNLLDRKSSLLLTHIDKFRDAYAKTIQHHQFKLDAMVVLPDHVHIMITLPPDSDNYAVIVASLKSQFSRQINKTEIITSSRQAKRERGIWQRRFWEHRIRDDADYRQHMDYIHNNPVKHGYVTNPQDWQYSTLHTLIKKGVYPAGWGTDENDKSINIRYDS
ncbi:conserved hypothetical protein [Psychrobacter arcticus 273-4]|uniref:Transposase IS200-like domain-containing protein n=1 Tax=Psychrobacter arcticus (strain DSM 17307 / VKM B-2377 / 273-4) TaxID=259536 RepID=Q4FV44_PSYA2|nr:transposase [Psychrobacter arcticus]AAZ18114.1 conserved hypothetical protein [Psychrobacter arcticus 273-4]